MRPLRADYSWQIVAGVVCLIDLDLGGMSVTNDAENVIQDLVAAGVNLDAMPVIYRDSMSRWDQLAVRDEKFAGYLPIGAASLREALSKVRRPGDIPKTTGAH